MFARIVQGVEAVVKEAGIDPGQIRGMGIGIPGQIELGTTRVKFAPNLDWRDVDLHPLMPATWRWPLVVENDVRMGTYGEFAHGAARGAKNVLGVFVGTGVGGGMILNGELYTGFNGNAGEIGHLIVHWRQGTHLEGVAGRKYMMKRAKDILDDAPEAGAQGVEGRGFGGCPQFAVGRVLPEGRPGRGAVGGRRGPRRSARRSAAWSTSSVRR